MSTGQRAACVWVAFLAGLCMAAGGCRNEADPPTLTLRGDGARDVYLVTHKEDYYHLCKKCQLGVDRDHMLCDELGRRVGKEPIFVPASADRLRVRPDGMVLAWVEDSWTGVGQVTLLRLHERPIHKDPLRPCCRLWEMGVQVVPGNPGTAQIRPVDWVLRREVKEKDLAKLE